MDESSEIEAPNFADVVDSANYLAELHNSSSLAPARAKAAPEQVQLPDGTWPVTECIDCGENIEPGRLALCRVRCFFCQTSKEDRERRQHGRR